jgi:TolB-like protein/Tfp pilus assembly protein PilF
MAIYRQIPSIAVSILRVRIDEFTPGSCWVEPEINLGVPTYETPPVDQTPDRRLDSWKEIAAYLSRDVTTVQRWEKREGMPVHRHLHERRGSVYALTGELDDWIQSRRARLDETEEKPGAEAPSTSTQHYGATPTRGIRLQFAVLALVCIGVLAAAWLLLRHLSPAAGQTAIRSIAVLPLRNLSADPAQDYLADGISEALIGRLANIHSLQVTSHTSVIRFRNSQLSIPEIAKTLGVDAVVEGSVIREGDRIRVTAQLIRGATDQHFWSESYDREMRDALSLESELAQTIAEKVEVTVTGEEHKRLSAARPVAPEVYESYLKGRFALGLGNRAGEEQSIHDFEDALRRDATFAPAYLGLAQAYSALGTVFSGVPPATTRPKVISFARKALDIDPNLVEAHDALAFVLEEEWHWSEAEDEYRHAIALNPNDADAHAWFALWLVCEGRSDEAVAEVQRARALDPIGISGVRVSMILFHARRYNDAVRESRSALALQPDNALNLMDLGFDLIANNQAAEAIPVLEKALFLSHRSPAVMGVLIRAYAHAGRRGDAIRLLSELKRRKEAGYIPAAAFVNAYLGLGDNEQAFYWLEQAYKEESNILQFLKSHPYFDQIRSDPRFADLVRRVGLS